MKLAHRIAHAHLGWTLAVLIFWVLQGIAWMCVMAYLQFFDHHLGYSVLYVTQVSNWALVLSSWVGATAAWGMIAVKIHHRATTQHCPHCGEALDP